MSALLRVFVYGTLKRGQANHERYCRGYAAVEAAAVLGRLYQMPQGYPTLIVPQTLVLAEGTSDPLADVATQARLSLNLPPELASPPAAGDWRSVVGEILSFNDPLTRLPALDSLEDFRPSHRSLYLRVLVRMERGDVVWTYVAPAGQVPAGATLWLDAWP